MNDVVKRGLKKLIAGALLCLSLVGCQTPTPADRIAKNPAMFKALPIEQQALVQQGKICEGMKEDAVFLAWGKPDTPLTVGEMGGKKITRWIYRGYEPITVVNDSPYPYWGPYGWYGYSAPYISTAYIPREVGYVEFVNGRVKSWLSKPAPQN
ncbi:MAG: hypothetical protein IKZ07_04830 [Akkermansia sp.]|nr:hypothetical protein [Akkermansia sp.]